MKKNIFILLLAICCLVIPSVSYANVDTDMQHEALPTLEPLKMNEEELAIYEQAIAQYDGAIINDRLMTAFKEEFGEQDGFPSRYPDNFAGTYLNENGQLVIQICGSKNTKSLNNNYSSYINIEEIKKHDNGFKADRVSDIVVYEQVEYSLNQLNDIMNDATKKLSKDLPIISSYVDTLSNRIVLEVEQQVFDVTDVDSQVALYKSTEYPEKEIPLIIQPASVPQLASHHLGGQGYYYHGNGGGCTLGFTGWYNGVRSYLTCGHTSAFSANDIAKYENTSIGTVTIKQWENGGSGDWSIVKLNSGETISGLIKQNYSGSVVGKIKSRTNTPTVNQIVYTFGNTTKVWSSYQVKKVSMISEPIDPPSNTTYKIKGITSMTLKTGQIISKGDSGSPVVIVAPDGYSALGVIHGFSGTSTGLFSAMTHVPSNFAVEIGY